MDTKDNGASSILLLVIALLLFIPQKALTVK